MSDPGTGGVVEVYRDGAGEWRWHQKAVNGEVVADCGEGYLNAADALAIAETFARALKAELVVKE